MSDSTLFNAQAFLPYNGGHGVRLSASTASSAGAIPGSEAQDNDRVVVTNSGAVSAAILMGTAGIQASLACFAVLPGDSVLLSLPLNLPTQVYIAAITASGSTTIQATAGRGM